VLLVEEHYGDIDEALNNAYNSHPKRRNLIGKYLGAGTS
jgi:hypothetical protein